MKSKTIFVILISIIILIITANSVQAVVYIEKKTSNTKTSSSNSTSSNTSTGMNITTTNTTSTVMNNVNKKSSLRIISMSIENEDIKLEPKFDENIHEYTINYEGDLESIPIKIIPNQQNADEKITGNEDLQDGENEILITVTSKDKKESIEYKITVKKNMKQQEEVENIQDNNKYYSEEHVQYGWIIVGVILAVLTMILIIMIIIGKRNKKKRRK